MLVRLLGPLELEVDGVANAVSGLRPRALLTALLLRPNAVVPAHALAEAVWGDAQPDNVNNALHITVARLRKALGSAADVVVTRPPGYLARVDESAIDAYRFEHAYRAARDRSSGDPAGAAALLDEALALWRGPAYGEFADGFARSGAVRLEELRLAALEDRVALLLRCGSAAEAVAKARDLAEQLPLRERPVEVLMRALHAVGRTGEALDAFQRHRALVVEQGLDPGPALREVQARILRDDLERPPPPHIELTSPAIVHDLPWRPSAIIGRDREVTLLLEALERRRLVTLVGPGGVGKTRLALEGAHHLAAEGRSVWWADLTVVTPQRVVDALATATGAEIQRTGDTVGSLCAALGAHRGVLCLDNAEHLLGELAPIVERVVDAAPNLVVLATSRERLAIDAESVRVLAPLPLPADGDRDSPAVRLFVERAPDLEADGLADNETAVVADICRRLDGLPLAIELAAARSTTFGLGELAGRLGDRLDLLGGGRRTADVRHRTLRAVVDWSHEVLTGEEARLFARLAVFPGSFSLDQAEGVCADSVLPRDRIAALVARLVDQSLLQSGRGRFRWLETLRAYAQERLARSGDGEWMRERHARDTAARLAGLDGRMWTKDEPVVVAGVAELAVDLHAAWDHAAAHDRGLAVQLAADVYDYAYLRQRLDMLDWGLQVASWDVEHPQRPRALAAASAAAWAGGRLDEAWRYAVAAGDDHPACGRALQQTGNLAMFASRNDDAIARFHAAAELHRTGGEQVRALLDDISVEQARTYGGHAAEAADRMEELVARAVHTGCPSAVCWAYYVAGLAIEHADVDRARTAYAKAVEYGSRADCRLLVMIARSYALSLVATGGSLEEALTEFQQVFGEWEGLGNEMVQWWMLSLLVLLLARAGADGEAAVLAGAVVAARDRQPLFPREVERFDRTVEGVRDRLGAATDRALARGAELTYAATVAHAREAIAGARHRLPP